MVTNIKEGMQQSVLEYYQVRSALPDSRGTSRFSQCSSTTKFGPRCPTLAVLHDSVSARVLPSSVRVARLSRYFTIQSVLEYYQVRSALPDSRGSSRFSQCSSTTKFGPRCPTLVAVHDSVSARVLPSSVRVARLSWQFTIQSVLEYYQVRSALPDSRGTSRFSQCSSTTKFGPRCPTLAALHDSVSARVLPSSVRVARLSRQFTIQSVLEYYQVRSALPDSRGSSRFSQCSSTTKFGPRCPTLAALHDSVSARVLPSSVRVARLSRQFTIQSVLEYYQVRSALPDSRGTSRFSQCSSTTKFGPRCPTLAALHDSVSARVLPSSVRVARLSRHFTIQSVLEYYQVRSALPDSRGTSRFSQCSSTTKFGPRCPTLAAVHDSVSARVLPSSVRVARLSQHFTIQSVLEYYQVRSALPDSRGSSRFSQCSSTTKFGPRCPTLAAVHDSVSARVLPSSVRVARLSRHFTIQSVLEYYQVRSALPDSRGTSRFSQCSSTTKFGPRCPTLAALHDSVSARVLPSSVRVARLSRHFTIQSVLEYYQVRYGLPDSRGSSRFSQCSSTTKFGPRCPTLAVLHDSVSARVLPSSVRVARLSRQFTIQSVLEYYQVRSALPDSRGSSRFSQCSSTTKFGPRCPTLAALHDSVSARVLPSSVRVARLSRHFTIQSVLEYYQVRSALPDSRGTSRFSQCSSTTKFGPRCPTLAALHDSVSARVLPSSVRVARLSRHFTIAAYRV